MNFVYFGFCSKASINGILICKFLKIFKKLENSYQFCFISASKEMEVRERMVSFGASLQALDRAQILMWFGCSAELSAAQPKILLCSGLSFSSCIMLLLQYLSDVLFQKTFSVTAPVVSRSLR